MNTAQRLIVGVWSAAAITLLFLHNPLSGYAGMYQENFLDVDVWNTSDADCAKSSLQKHQAFNRHEWLIQALDNAKNANNPEVTASQNATLYAHNQFNKCVITSRKYYPDELMPIEGWRSKDSYVPKLGTVVSVLWAQGCIAAIAIVALLISRTLREVQA